MTMRNFPLIQELLVDNVFESDHYAVNLSANDPILPALEYFLSLKNVTGFWEKFKDFKIKPRGTVTTNQRRVQWASFCAEFGAICLLGRTLGIPIVGFDQTSPHAARKDSDCDVVAMINGKRAFIEVKRNAAEDKQILPELLEKRLTDLELPYSISVELLNRNYDCSDLSSRLIDIQRHVESLQHINAGKDVLEWNLEPFMTGSFSVWFHEKDKESGAAPTQYLSPVFTDNLKPYIVGPAANGRNGKPMKPMVVQAIEKGANYLFCRIPGWQPWQEVVEECFATVDYYKGQTYFTKDSTLQNLHGIVLFTRFDRYCIVNNLNFGNGEWLGA